MDTLNHGQHADVAEVFAELLALLEPVWPETSVDYVREEVGHGEYEDALDNLIAIGLDNEHGFDQRQLALIRNLAGAMDLTNSAFMVALQGAYPSGGMVRRP